VDTDIEQIYVHYIGLLYKQVMLHNFLKNCVWFPSIIIILQY